MGIEQGGFLARARALDPDADLAKITIDPERFAAHLTPAADEHYASRPQHRRPGVRLAVFAIVALVGASLVLDWWMFFSTASGNPGDRANAARFVLRIGLSAAYAATVWRVCRRLPA